MLVFVFQMKLYRFSISWARIMPDNTTVNQLGIDYYNRLIDELVAADIEPLVIIFRVFFCYINLGNTVSCNRSRCTIGTYLNIFKTWADG